PPGAWQRAHVEAHLQELENRRIALQQRLVRAQQVEEIRGQLARAEADLQAIEARGATLADELGFDPSLTATSLDRFVRLAQDYDRANRDCDAARTLIEGLDAAIDAQLAAVKTFLDQWQVPTAGKDLDAL